MARQPTLEEIQIVLDESPENFSNPTQFQRSIDNAFRHGNGPVGQVIQDQLAQTLYADYLSNGGEPIIFLDGVVVSTDGDGTVMDTEQGTPCLNCVSAEPCCLSKLTITDKANTTRTIEWPLEIDGPAHMLVIADQVNSFNLFGEVSVAREGRACLQANPLRPAIEVHNSLDTGPQQEIRENVLFDEKIGAPLPPSLTALRSAFPDDAVKYLIIFDMAANMSSMASMMLPATFSDRQCLPGPSQALLSVSAVPQFEISGEGNASATLVFSTAGINFHGSLTGSLQGKFGAQELKAEAVLPTGNTPLGSQNSSRNQPGVLGTILDMFGKMDSAAVASGGKQPLGRSLVAADYATRIEISPSLTLKCGSIKLEAKDRSPDLKLTVDSVEVTLALRVSGFINLLEMLANAIGGFGRAVTEAQARMANGEAVVVDIRTEIGLSAQGSLTSGVSFGAPIEVKHNGEVDYKGMDPTGTFSGRFRVLGSGQLQASIHAEIWVFTVRAGVAATTVTAWTWEFRNQNGKKQRRSYFEGVYVAASASVGLDSGTRSENETEAGRTSVSRSQRTIDMGLGTPVDITVSGAPLPNQIPPGSNGVIEIWPPTVQSINENAPTWTDF